MFHAVRHPRSIGHFVDYIKISSELKLVHQWRSDQGWYSTYPPPFWLTCSRCLACTRADVVFHFSSSSNPERVVKVHTITTFWAVDSDILDELDFIPFCPHTPILWFCWLQTTTSTFSTAWHPIRVAMMDRLLSSNGHAARVSESLPVLID